MVTHRETHTHPLVGTLVNTKDAPLIAAYEIAEGKKGK